MFPPKKDAFRNAMSSNAAWAATTTNENPSFFTDLANKQAPAILWLGCSDSRVPESTILGLQPGEAFVHRNIANIIGPTDLNTISVVEYAVRYVRVEHIIVCGHTNCAGCVATLTSAELGGVLDTWLTQLRAVRDANDAELDNIDDLAARAIRLAEMSVEAGTATVMANHAVKQAVRERGLQVHATIYNTANGLLRDLGFGTGGKDVTDVVRDVVGAHIASVQEERVTVTGSHGMLVFSEEGEVSMAVR